MSVATYFVTMAPAGSLVLPPDVVQRFGLESGAALILCVADTGMALLTREQLKRRVRDDLAGLDLVADLLAERRVSAEAEDLVADGATWPEAT